MGRKLITSSMNCWEDVSGRFDRSLGPVTISIIITPKLNMSNFSVIWHLSMYSGGMYPLHDRYDNNLIRTIVHIHNHMKCEYE